MKIAALLLFVSALCGGYLGARDVPDEGGADRAQRAVETASLTQWQSEFQSKRNRSYSQAEHRTLLTTVRSLSSEFGERLPLSGDRDAVAVLLPERARDAEARLDAHLLALWLNIASGAVSLDDDADADADGDGTAETTVDTLLRGAAAEREASEPRRAALRTYAVLLEQVSTADVSPAGAPTP